MTSEPRELGTQMNELKSLSFHLNQSERASSDLLSEKKMNRNTKPLMTLLRIKGNWFPSPQNAQWNVITSYNEKHQDAPIELTAAESFKVADAYAWVLEGRYDAFFDIKLSFEKAVTAEDGPYHQYADKLSWFPYKGIPTYPLIHRDEKGEKFAKEYEKSNQRVEGRWHAC